MMTETLIANLAINHVEDVKMLHLIVSNVHGVTTKIKKANQNVLSVLIHVMPVTNGESVLNLNVIKKNILRLNMICDL